ncbi:MAG: phenylalanine--tRNA ligase subunit beta [Erysipelotrichaceae bacterium]|nr:phenylalanine--tRNA ligase subunit beta [Erysipelotrichaceae bacterium]
MKISYNWLKEYVSLDGVTPNDLADKLTQAGLEIEGIEKVANGDNLVIGKVLSVKPHPDSNHLKVCDVDYGQGSVQIVCGAPNVKENQKVIVAKVGANLPELTIKKGVIRGVESNGMICALFELGVDKKHLSEEQLSGIEVLSDDAPIGEDPLKYLGLDDVVLDASPTPNRADCMSMWGVAKEVGAVLKRKATIPYSEGAANVGKETSLIIDSKSKNCPVFVGKVVNKVVVKPSPKWMVDYLHAAGVKSINNIVDISNYVMLETGQPLHFYDADKFEKKEITVIDGLNSTITALDGIEYQLEESDLIITTNNEAIGLAGIMGGDESKIEENTKSIIIEAALFNHVTIRTTANRLGLNTEASSRFVKGIEPLAQIKAVDRSVALLLELAEADDFEKTVIFGNPNYEPIQVVETIEHCNELLGTNYTIEQVKEVLDALDFNVRVDKNTFTCTIPSYRTDIKIKEDIDEEIIRLIGFDTLPMTLPKMVATIGELDEKQKLERLTKNIMKSYGLSEIVTYSLVKEEYVLDGIMPFGDHIKLASPLSDDRKFIRNSLMPSMLECVSYNQNRKASNINLFEISNVYEKDIVQTRLSIALNGELQSSKLHKVSIKNDFYTLKGLLETYLEKLGIASSRVSIKANEDNNYFHPYRSAKIYIQNKLFGIFGEISPLYSKKLDIENVIYGEFIMDVLYEIKTPRIKFTPLDRYPSVSRDIALIVDDSLEAKKILDVINKNGGKLIKSLEIFDVYKGEHIEDGKKSIALKIVYQSKDKTLTEAEVSKVHENILEKLEKEVNAQLRS